jgi:hypothetical protein
MAGKPNCFRGMSVGTVQGLVIMPKLLYRNIVPVDPHGDEQCTFFSAKEMIDGPSLNRSSRRLRGYHVYVDLARSGPPHRPPHRWRFADA